MQNALKFLRTFGLYIFAIVAFGLVFASCAYLIRSCNGNVEQLAETLATKAESANSSETQKLLSKVESLEKQDSILIEKQKQIDSLRTELHSLKLSVTEQYRFLQNRYTNSPAKR